MIPLHLDSITFSDQTTVPLQPGSIVVLVGPNNVGKSRALREVYTQLSTPTTSPPNVVITDISTTKLVDADGALSWLREHSHVVRRAGREVMGRPQAGEIDIPSIGSLWNQGGVHLHQLAPFFALFANTEQRLQLVGSTPSFEVRDQPPSTALQNMYLDDRLERQLSDAAHRAFKVRLTVNRIGGSHIHLHVGVPKAEGLPLVQNAAYREAMGELPLVQEEGDGVRSYVGVLLSVTAARYPIVLIDEPEAFLHPPQARQLGRELTKMVGKETQLIAGTHSAEFLEGVLDSARGNVTIVRLTRKRGVNHAAVLDRSQLAEVWGDPLLRYSLLLDGLFHAGVVLCEGDSDCRFYEASLEAALEGKKRSAHDLLFTHTGGKHRLPTAIAALRNIGVPVFVAADFDVLADKTLLEKLVGQLGGRWASVEKDWRVVSSAVEQLGKQPPLVAVKEEIRRILDGADGPVLTKGVAKKVRDATKLEDGWARAKAAGTGALRGQARQASERLLTTLRAMGLHVVPVGELESWAQDVPGHGPEWVSAALEAKAHERDDAHVKFVLGFLK